MILILSKEAVSFLGRKNSIPLDFSCMKLSDHTFAEHFFEFVVYIIFAIKGILSLKTTNNILHVSPHDFLAAQE